MKYLLLIPDGVAIRNFLYSHFIDLLLEEGEAIVWHALPENRLVTPRRIWGEKVQWYKLPAFREGVVERVLRQAKIDAQMYWQYTEDSARVMFQKRVPSENLLHQIVLRMAHLLGFIAGFQPGVRWLDQAHFTMTQRATYLRDFEAFLQKERPDVVFCTHQRASRAVPAMVAARKLGIPTATFIYSWDNLPKGRMAVPADHYLVWSNWMAEELLRYYPEVSADHVHIVGTPQFEHYFRTELIESREQFLGQIGLDPIKPVVCFSGDDKTTSPHDPQYLADLAEVLRMIPEAERPQILFRRCPVDLSDRYNWVLSRYPEIAVSDPLWLRETNGDWTQIVPTAEDITLLVNVVHHCEVVVNVGSTMAMDFAILGKPGIFINYNPSNVDGFWRIENIYRLPHFRMVHQLQPVYWANSPSDLFSLVQQVLTNPYEKQQARMTWQHTIVAHPLSEASRRCFDVLNRIGAK